jgi:prepilin-type N-terminal cleavage/methylation domain-containing protein/prepilin-type processing-associated H-X9-DG protein
MASKFFSDTTLIQTMIGNNWRRQVGLDSAGCLRTNGRGFTLIELLVVIAVIAILASLLLPVLARAKDSGLGATCLSNTKQIGYAVLMYADDNKQVFPDPGPPSKPVWWSPGPYKNRLGQTCGGEWLLTDQVTANTPAPMVEPYLRNPLAWVCPKRRRGLTFTTAPGSFDPSLTGFLSYGFNEIGCFCLANVNGGGMQTPTPPFKLTLARQPANLLCVSEVSGSNDPHDSYGNGGAATDPSDPYCADAAWLDDVWGSSTGPSFAANSENGRLQTAWGKHNNAVNVLWVDGHAQPTLVSKLTWGEFWGVYGSPRVWPALPNGGTWYDSISKPAYDSQVWSNLPE